MTEAGLQVLRAQIEPHFLFNTLANVRRLYAKDHAVGRAMMESPMRYLAIALPQMRGCDTTLGCDADLVEAYLHIQQIRMGPRLAFTFDIRLELRAHRIWPMMLLALVENAIRHGLNPSPNGGLIRVMARTSSTRLNLTVADTGVGFTSASGSGIGLANISARLAAQFGNQASLTLENNELGGATARIELPLDERGRKRGPHDCGALVHSPVTLPISKTARAGANFGAALRGAVTRLSWRVLLITLAIVVALVVWWAFETAFGGSGPSPPITGTYLPGTVTILLLALSIMFTTLVADELVASGARPLPAYAYAVVTGSAVGTLAQWAAHEWRDLRWPLEVAGTALEVSFARPTFVFFESLIWGSIIVFIYVNRRSALRAAARLNAAQVLRAALQRRTLEARLQALQARIEPQFLFNSLARLRDLYEADPAKGAQVLSDLIVYLRTALPRLREPATTLGQELDLLTAYLNVMHARPGERTALAVDVPHPMRAARMPAMVLLPLTNRILAGGLLAGVIADPVRISAGSTGASLRVEIMASGEHPAAGHASGEPGDVEQRLQALYGEEWTLTFEPWGECGRRAVMEIPYESADSSHC